MKIIYIFIFSFCFCLNLSLHDYDNPSASHILDAHVMDDLLIVVGMVGGIEVYDISNPQVLNHLANFNLPNNGGGGQGNSRPNCVSNKGNITYFTAKNGVAMVNLANPSNPENLGYISGTSNLDLENLDVYANYLIICAHTDGVLFYDILNPDSPELLFHLESENAWTVTMKDGNDSDEFQVYAYVGDGQQILAYGLNDEEITFIGSIHTGSAVKDVVADNIYLYAALGSAGINIYDISGELGGSNGIPHYIDNFNTEGMANRLTLSGSRLGVADWDDVEILQFNSLGSLEKIGFKNTTRRTMAITAKDNYFYSAEWASIQIMEYGLITNSDIDLDTYELNYPYVNNGDSFILSVNMTNNGGDVLEISDIFTTNNEFLTTSIESLFPGETETINVTYTAGNINASGALRIWSNDPDESDITCETNGNINGANIGEYAPDFELNIVANGTGNYQLSEHLGEIIVLAFFSPM